MKLKIKGFNDLKYKLNLIPEEVQKGVYEATVELTETVVSKAVSRLQSQTKVSSGELSNSVKAHVENEKGGISGTVFSDNPVSVFREFGTGPVGQDSPKDLPEGITPVYTQDPWLIPARDVSKDLNALYGMPKWRIKGEDFYYTHGQPARPFLYPSFKEAMENAENVYQDHIGKVLRKVGK